MGKKIIMIICLGLPILGHAQNPDTLIKKLDSLSKKTDSAGEQQNNINKKAYNEQTKITFSSYFILLGSDLKQEVTAPFHFTKKDWLRAAAFSIVEGSLFF